MKLFAHNINRRRHTRLLSDCLKNAYTNDIENVRLATLIMSISCFFFVCRREERLNGWLKPLFYVWQGILAKIPGWSPIQPISTLRAFPQLSVRTTASHHAIIVIYYIGLINIQVFTIIICMYKKIFKNYKLIIFI